MSMTTFLLLFTAFLLIVMLVKSLRLIDMINNKKDIDESLVTQKDNKTHTYLFLLFSIFFVAVIIFTFYMYSDTLLPSSASEHGILVDQLMLITNIIIIIPFVITQTLLFYFCYKYSSEKSVVSYITHINKLELIWTIIPTIVLTILIVYGLRTWDQIFFKEDSEEPIVIELYGKQFNWVVRYSGEDNKLGAANYKLIATDNELGINKNDPYSLNDIIIKDQLVLPANKNILFKFRSQDVIHSAYMPHFRTQMNCVPGIITEFKMKPIKTTEEMKIETKNENFEYILFCNKICGSAHYNMKLSIKVVNNDEFEKWISEQKTISNL